MNGAKEFDQTINKEGHRMPRNATMLAQQLTNLGFTNVTAKWNITFQADAPDGSGQMTKSIVGSTKKLVAGNGPSDIGGNGATSLDDARQAGSSAAPAAPASPPVPGSAVGASSKPSVFDS